MESLSPFLQDSLIPYFMPVYPGAPQHSTGPKTDEGKASSCLNNFRYGFCGEFTILPSENQEDYDTLLAGLRAEHRPVTVTEMIFVEKMAQHHWLSQRAVTLQAVFLIANVPLHEQEKQLSLFLRYQTANDRGFRNCLNDLLKLRAEKRRAEIGFESQERTRNEELRKEAAEKRKQDMHKMNVLLAEAKFTHQQLLNLDLEASINADSDPQNRAREQAAA